MRHHPPSHPRSARLTPVLALGLAVAMTALAAPAAQAECYADYKAKEAGSGALKLHYGVARVPDSACSPQAAAAQLGPRLARGGWVLLNVVSVFGPEGLAQRKASAGPYFLRF
ncbi:hypothetical protein [Phaeovulum vinaykumarii]|uniref:Secreted protein n=1 Tax=Phaeovulum vinaykumarii TaxID=407234 RepID=A0A1N7L4G7_9RHOB|nr:hypothetical protein [Phaeovulum vinaykumarii]SIS68749.1 hypothetical protein SAMN05421795_102549 [Phaeovulum vinaykumarii]SOB99877.1 hypothetical protein SAMN05878426_102223 [Phaeovulum vinaykumarii]